MPESAPILRPTADWLAAEALRRGLTGVALKDESEPAILADLPKLEP